MASDEEFPGIVLEFQYRKCAPATQKILGLKSTTIEEGIAEGWLPPPTPLTPYGRAQAWSGAELVAILKARKALARQQAKAEPKKTKKK